MSLDHQLKESLRRARGLRINVTDPDRCIDYVLLVTLDGKAPDIVELDGGIVWCGDYGFELETARQDRFSRERAGDEIYQRLKREIDEAVQDELERRAERIDD